MKINRDEGLHLNNKILLAEDDAPSRDAMERILAISGFVVDSAADGEAAWKKFAEMEETSQPYSLLIVDDQMPRLSGRELIRKVKDRNPSVPTIIMTGFGGDDFETQVAKLGCEAILYKPIETEELITLVRKILAESKRGKEKSQ